MIGCTRYCIYVGAHELVLHALSGCLTVSKEQVGKVYEVLKDRDVPADKQTWNRRYRAYTNKISTGDPIEVAKVLRDLALLRKNKNLSFGERKMYDHASSLLIQEISVAEDADEKNVKSKIEKIFKS